MLPARLAYRKRDNIVSTPVTGMCLTPACYVEYWALFSHRELINASSAYHEAPCKSTALPVWSPVRGSLSISTKWLLTAHSSSDGHPWWVARDTASIALPQE